MSGFWKTWLQVWCWATLGVGALFAAAAIPALEGGVTLFYDTIYWPIDGISPYGPEVRLTAALLGAVMIGWAIAIFGLVSAAETAGAPAWRTLTMSIVVWYAIDSTISVALGAPVNALSNTIFLVTFLIPILASGVLGANTGARSAIAQRS
ncbi:MAG: hypothetical protein NW206_05310 [Hyphomonadaceae bacterium]|nr:hypothetical protein [Hyphomonadaceae bacterium]